LQTRISDRFLNGGEPKCEQGPRRDAPGGEGRGVDVDGGGVAALLEEHLAGART
jgi:hypothetical protein